MAGIFQTIMMKVYDERMAAQSKPMFLSSFFGKDSTELVLSDTDRVEIDVIRDNRRLAVDVVRGSGQANHNTTGGFTNKEYKIPLYDEVTPITAGMLSKRLPGVDPYTPSGKMAALAFHAAAAQAEQSMKIIREIERMAAQALLAGTVTLRNTESLNFQRKGTHAVTVSTKWNAAADAGKPLDDIRSLADVVFQDGKLKPNTLVFGDLAWNVFINNKQVQEYFDKRLIDPGRIAPEERRDGATLQGRIAIGDYTFDLYTYNEFYLNDLGAAVPYVTPDSVIVFNRQARLTKAFGAVELLPDTNAHYRELGMPMVPEFQKGQIIPYVKEDRPVALWAGVQSAPLVVPTAIDTIGVLNSVDL